MKQQHKKGALELDKLGNLILAVILLIALLILIFALREKQFDLITTFKNIFR